MVCNFNTNCITDECSVDVTDINTCDCNDKNIILTESGLLPKNFTDFYICSTHFNQLLKRNSDLRRRKVCQLPTLISAHPPVASHSVVGVKKPKPSRNITINDVEKIQKCYGLTLPIGTPACTSCFIKISKQSTEIGTESLDQGKCEDDQAIDKSAKNVKYIVRVLEGTECRKTKYTPIPAISSYSNFTFSAHGITAWKAYQVGTGKLIPSSNIPTVEKCILNTSCSEIEGEIDVVFHQLSLKVEEEENTITCDNEGCTLSFSSFHELSSHLMFGKCEFEFRCQFSNGCDITKKTYITKMSKSFSTNFQVSSAGLTVGIDDNSDLELGWALKEERKNKRFNVNQKEYLTEKFNKGLKTGRKEDPFLVSEEMLTERKEDGNRRFSYDEILSVQQITSFFSRMSRKNKSFDDSVDASREETITTIRRELTADELN